MTGYISLLLLEPNSKFSTKLAQRSWKRSVQAHKAGTGKNDDSRKRPHEDKPTTSDSRWYTQPCNSWVHRRLTRFLLIFVRMKLAGSEAIYNFLIVCRMVFWLCWQMDGVSCFQRVRWKWRTGKMQEQIIELIFVLTSTNTVDGAVTVWVDSKLGTE